MFFPPLRDVVLFLHVVDYLSLASLLWWLHGYTTVHSRTRLQLRCALISTIGLAALLLLIALFGAVLYCWLLSLEVIWPHTRKTPDFADFSSCNYSS
jgi:hypothetical protein